MTVARLRRTSVASLSTTTTTHTHTSTSNSVQSQQQFKVYGRRWTMLTYSAVLNLLSDWVCYSVASLPSSVVYPHDPTLLVVVFFLANAVGTGMEPRLLEILGLRRTLLLGAWMLAAGNAVKTTWSVTFFEELYNYYYYYYETAAIDNYGNNHNSQAYDYEYVYSDQDHASSWRTYSGFFMVGLSQPLYQCTPALLSATWFPEAERTLATGVALSANQVGIGLAFGVGGLLSQRTLSQYFRGLTYASVLVFCGVALQFEDAPPSPPSDTARAVRGSTDLLTTACACGNVADHLSSVEIDVDKTERKSTASAVTVSLSDFDNESDANNNFDSFNDLNESKKPTFRPFRHVVTACLARPGFRHALAAFSTSGVVINVLSTYMKELSPRHSATIGALFQLVILVSSVTLGRVTDQSRAYYAVTAALLVAGGVALASVATSDRKEWSLLATAAAVGPLQPVATELAVDVVFPHETENSVLVVLQLVANLLSAAFVPLFGKCVTLATTATSSYVDNNNNVNNNDTNNDTDDTSTVRHHFLALYLLLVTHASVAVYFATFDGTYRRLEHEQNRKAQSKSRSRSRSRPPNQPRSHNHTTTTIHSTEATPLLEP